MKDRGTISDALIDKSTSKIPCTARRCHRWRSAPGTLPLVRPQTGVWWARLPARQTSTADSLVRRSTNVIVLVFIERLEPRAIHDRILLVIVRDACRYIFAHEISGDEISNVVAGVGTEIETWAVKRIDKSRGVADARPTIAANFLAVIWERRKCVHVSLDRMRVAKNFASNRIRQNVRVQSFRDIRAFRQLEDSAVVNNSGAHVAATEGNDPAPPTVSHQMVRRP